MRTCGRCGAELKLTRRILGKTVCAACEQAIEEEQRREAARLAEQRKHQLDAYRRALQPLYDGPVATIEAFSSMRQLQPGAELGPEDVANAKKEALHALAEQLMEDGRLAWWEETVLNNVGTALGAHEKAGWSPPFIELEATCWLGRANDGRLPASPMPSNVAGRRDEVAHLIAYAQQLDEVTAKELVLDQNAISFEFREGIAYQRGRLSGTEREVSRGIQEVDRGQLTVTSERIVFVGEHASEELPLTKLLGVQVYGDAVQFRISGRKRYPTFRFFGMPGDFTPAVIATVNTATQRANGVVHADSRPQIPAMPRVSDECERLLDRAAAAGTQEWELRETRLLFHLGWLDLPALEQRIAANESVVKAMPEHQSGSALSASVPLGGPSERPESEWDKEPLGEAVGADYEIQAVGLSFVEASTAPADVQPLGRLALLRVRIKNTSKAPIDFYGRHVVLKDAEETTYEAWTGGAEDTLILSRYFGEMLLSERLQPQLWHAGSIAFDLPVDTSPTALEAPHSLAEPRGETMSIPLGTAVARSGQSEPR